VTPERTWKKMQSAACDGDAAEFFRHVDKAAMKETISHKVREALEAEGKNNELTDAFFPAIVDKAFGEAMDEWETDVKHGKDGDFCSGKFLSADNSAGRVSWKTPSGKTKTATFLSAGDGFLMTAVE
jgi:hypothetical protein